MLSDWKFPDLLSIRLNLKLGKCSWSRVPWKCEWSLKVLSISRSQLLCNGGNLANQKHLDSGKILPLEVQQEMKKGKGQEEYFQGVRETSLFQGCGCFGVSFFVCFVFSP